MTRHAEYPRAAARRRVHCKAVFLDGGGVIVLPHGRLVRRALSGVGIEVEASAVAAAHYEAVRQLDREARVEHPSSDYLPALCRALRVPEDGLTDACTALSHLADRRLSGEILWSEAAPGARRTIAALGRAGIAVFVVTNSDGHAAENLRDADICQVATGDGAPVDDPTESGVIVDDVIDSGLVGSAKPERAIFEAALERARVDPESVVHVGDMLSTDVAGARAAGIIPIHLDPHRSCRDRDHRHIRTLAAIWRHVAPDSAA